MKSHGEYRIRPLSLGPVLRMTWAIVGRSLCRNYFQHIPGVEYRMENPDGETFTKSATIVANHRSQLETDILKTLAPGMPVLSIHKDLSSLSNLSGKDILPIFFIGADLVVPRNSKALYKGRLLVSVGNRMNVVDASHIRQIYQEEYAKLVSRTIDAHDYHGLVLDRYRYKGTEIFNAVKRNLRKHDDYAEWIGSPQVDGTVMVKSEGYGEKALLYALCHPDREVLAIEEDAEKRELLRYCAEGLVSNLRILAVPDSSKS